MCTSTATKRALTRTRTSTTHITGTSRIFRGTEPNPTRMLTATASSRMSIRTTRTCTTGTATPDGHDAWRAALTMRIRTIIIRMTFFYGAGHEVSTAGGGNHRTGLGRPGNGGRDAGVRPGDQRSRLSAQRAQGPGRHQVQTARDERGCDAGGVREHRFQS